MLAAVIVAVIVGTAAYVVSTTDKSRPVGLSVAPGAFTRGKTLDASIRRALFSPNGALLAAIGDGVGVARQGRLEPVTEPGSAAVDAAWMPDSNSLLVVEGPAVVERLTVLTLDGDVKGVSRLDVPFSVGGGNGMTVDSRGARAVMAAETRDAIWGRRRLDLVLVDLPTGRVTQLTTTPDANEAWPLFLDDGRVVFTRSDATNAGTVVELDLTTRAERQVSPDDESARTVGVVLAGRVVYTATSDDGKVTIWAAGTRRRRLAGLPAESLVWSVDPSASLAVATLTTTTPEGERLPLLRAVTLKAPSAG